MDGEQLAANRIFFAALTALKGIQPGCAIGAEALAPSEFALPSFDLDKLTAGSSRCLERIVRSLARPVFDHPTVRWQTAAESSADP
jgi:hypothetical protein